MLYVQSKMMNRFYCGWGKGDWCVQSSIHKMRTRRPTSGCIRRKNGSPSNQKKSQTKEKKKYEKKIMRNSFSFDCALCTHTHRAATALLCAIIIRVAAASISRQFPFVFCKNIFLLSQLWIMRVSIDVSPNQRLALNNTTTDMRHKNTK